MLDINLNYDPAMNHNYDIEGRVHTSPQNYYGNLENHQPHYIQYRFEDAYSGEFYDGRETRSFVIYPAPAASLLIASIISSVVGRREPYGEYSLELSDDGNSNTKFFRFKMAD